jgi:RHS repeat-associated protein
MTSDTGTVLNSYTYSAFGQSTSQTGSTTNDHQFTGEQLDPTGLYYDRARYYNPTLGHFMQRDSYGGTLDNPQSQNRYTYASNNPTLYSDPSGHFAFLLALAGAFIGGMAIDFAAQAVNNYIHRGSSHTFDNIDGRMVIAGGVGGVAGLLTGEIGLAALGFTGLAGVAFTAAASGLVAAGSDRATAQALGVPTRTMTTDEVISLATISAIIGVAGEALTGFGHSFKPTKDPSVVQLLIELSNRPNSANPGFYESIMGELPTEIPTNLIRFSQSKVKLVHDEGPLAGKTIYEVADGLRGKAVDEQYHIGVFIKTPEMDSWIPEIYKTGKGKVYTGDYKNLENFHIYAQNNRGFSERILADLKVLKVKWLTSEEVQHYSYQYDTPNGGTATTVKDTDPPVVIKVPMD